MVLKEGENLPYFVLKDDSGNSVTSDMLNGKKATLLFSMDNGSHAYLEELWNVRDNLDKIKAKFPVLYVISDGSQESLMKLRNDNKLNFSLLSDSKKTFASTCGFNSLFGNLKNAAILLNKESVVLKILESKRPNDMVKKLIDCIGTI